MQLSDAITTSVLAHLSGWRQCAPPGRLRVVFITAGGSVSGSFDMPESLDDGCDELFMRDLLLTVESVGTPGVVLAVARTDARPMRRDGRRWETLQAWFEPSPVELIDYVTVSAARHWSARNRRSTRRPAARL